MKEKLLHERMHQIKRSPQDEDVRIGEIDIAMNVLERLKNNAPEVFKTVLNMIDDIK
jgi:hypothetical protein